MSGQRVERVRTPMSPEELVDVLARGHTIAFGEPPGESRLRMAWSQVMLENGRGRWVWCWNIGNITTGRGYAGPYFVDVEQERIGRGPPGHPELDVWRAVELHFRAQPDAIAGAAAYWRRLDEDFAEALPFFDAGDVHGAVSKLSELVYFTARAEPYERGVNLIAREFEDALWNYPS